ncbi:MAG: nucleotidyltransferase domain-containing protein [Planctomycetota bacterium]
MFIRHGQDTQTLHAELLALLMAEEAERDWALLAGSFATKTVNGTDYVYFQYSDAGGGKRQFSIGADSPALRRIVAGYRKERAAREADRERITRLGRLLATSGQTTVPAPVARVLRSLADAGVFKVGGILVGTHAFALLGNMLGVAWPGAAWRTEDVDVAAHLEIATPQLTADVPAALESLQMGFVPVPSFDPRHPSTSFKVRGKQLRVDLVTPGSERDTEPIVIPRLRAAAAPIKYLSLLMAEPQPAPAVNGGAVLVVVPDPARYALHKLLISQTRSVVQQTKVGKDLHQAALLLEVLAEDRPDDVEQACAAFRKSGPAVTKKVIRAARAAVKQSPDAAAGIDLVSKHLA